MVIVLKWYKVTCKNCNYELKSLTTSKPTNYTCPKCKFENGKEPGSLKCPQCKVRDFVPGVECKCGFYVGEPRNLEDFEPLPVLELSFKKPKEK